MGAVVVAEVMPNSRYHLREGGVGKKRREYTIPCNGGVVSVAGKFSSILPYLYRRAPVLHCVVVGFAFALRPSIRHFNALRQRSRSRRCFLVTIPSRCHVTITPFIILRRAGTSFFSFVRFATVRVYLSLLPVSVWRARGGILSGRLRLG